MKYVLTILFLIILSIEDIKEKEISVPLVIGFLVVALITGIFVMTNKLEILLGLIPGAALILVSGITRGKIGVGDGIVTMGIGMCFGLVTTCSIFLIGIAASTAAGLIIIAIKKKEKDYSLPFVPFLLIGTTVFLGVGG